MRRGIVRTTRLKLKHSAPGAASVLLELNCGHSLFRKASAYRGKTAECRECATPIANPTPSTGAFSTPNVKQKKAAS